MWNPFRKQPLLRAEDRQFQIECYEWLLKHFGGVEFYQETHLVLPTREHFPLEVSSNEEAARATFSQVKKYAGLESWPCELKAQEEEPNLLVAPTVAIRGVKQAPLGTFSANQNRGVTITYNPKIISDPLQMVATFAHELAHYLTSTAPEPPPGGWENWEFATDVAATFLGFGVFVANAAFTFRQYSDVDSQGWRTEGGGYLSEAEHSHALAIFLLLKGIPESDALPHCCANVRAYLAKALKELRGSAEIEALRQVEYIQREPPEESATSNR